MTDALSPADITPDKLWAWLALPHSVLPWHAQTLGDFWRLFEAGEFGKKLIKAPHKSVEYSCYWPDDDDENYLLAAANNFQLLASHTLALRGHLTEISKLRMKEYEDAEDRAVRAEAALVQARVEMKAMRLEIYGLSSDVGSEFDALILERLDRAEAANARLREVLTEIAEYKPHRLGAKGPITANDFFAQKARQIARAALAVPQNAASAPALSPTYNEVSEANVPSGDAPAETVLPSGAIVEQRTMDEIMSASPYDPKLDAGGYELGDDGA